MNQDKKFSLKDVITNDFYNQMKMVDPKIKKIKTINVGFFLMIAPLIIYFLFKPSIYYEITNNPLTNIVLSCFMVYTFLWIATFIVIYCFAKIISLFLYKNIATINYKNNEIFISNFETDFPLTDLNKDFKIDLTDKNNFDSDFVELVQLGLERGAFYNYEVSIIKSIQKIENKNSLKNSNENVLSFKKIIFSFMNACIILAVFIAFMISFEKLQLAKNIKIYEIIEVGNNFIVAESMGVQAKEKIKLNINTNCKNIEEGLVFKYSSYEFDKKFKDIEVKFKSELGLSEIENLCKKI